MDQGAGDGWGAGIPPAWLLEQERALDRLRVRVHDLETTAEVERDTVAPYAIAATGIFALLVSFTLPWLVSAETGEAIIGWSLLVSPKSSPVVAGAAYLVLLAVPLQALGLVGRTTGTAIIAAAATGLAGLGAVAIMGTAVRDPLVDVGNGAVICVLVLLVLPIAWAGITESRRWSR